MDYKELKKSILQSLKIAKFADEVMFESNHKESYRKLINLRDDFIWAAISDHEVLIDSLKTEQQDIIEQLGNE
jgi:hypothetical protein